MMLSFAALHMSACGTKPPCHDVRYNAALGGLAELVWMRCGRRD